MARIPATNCLDTILDVFVGRPLSFMELGTTLDFKSIRCVAPLPKVAMITQGSPNILLKQGVQAEKI